MELSAWDKVCFSRHPGRPYFLDYVGFLFSHFKELKGDRCFGDDRAIIGGIAEFEGRKVIAIGHQKGRNLAESKLYNFGMAKPDGYRKALRLMKIAEKFSKPVINFIDTPGAFPGVESERRGQAEAIARNLLEMSRLKVPIISIIIGEGGSGGALGIGVSDCILMLEHAWCSVVSPEGCSSILFKTVTKTKEVASALKLDSKFLKEVGVVDEVIHESILGAHVEIEDLVTEFRAVMVQKLDFLSTLSENQLLKNRYEKYRMIGKHKE